MVTAEELWDQIEADYEQRVVEVEGVLEQRFDATVLAELAQRLHAAQFREQEKALRALNMATRRMQRARRMGRRAMRLLEAAHRLHAKVHDIPIASDEHVLAVARKRHMLRVKAALREAGHAD